MATPSARPYEAIPEPPRSGPLGHLAEWLGTDNARSVLGRLLRYGEQCGPLARVDLGPVRMLVISDPDVANDVLRAPEANYKGMAYILTRAVLDNVLLQNGATWEKSRKLYRQAFRDVDPLAPVHRLVPPFVQQLASRREGEPVTMDELLLRLSGDVVGGFVAAVRHTDDFEPHRRRIQYELAAVGIDLQCQPWAYLDPARWVKLRQSVSFTRRFFRDAVVKRRAAPDDSIPDVLNGFLALARSGEYPDDDDAIEEALVNSFFTAHDVLSSALTWCAHLLASHPETQARLRSSLRELPEGPLSRQDIDAHPFLACVAKESLRLYPGYPLFGRTTRAPMLVGGHLVPKGTMLIVTPFVMHRLERYWPDAGRFDPERWAGRALGTPAPYARECFMPFGSGDRGCLGFHIAFPIMKAIVAHLVRELEIATVPGHTPDLAYLGTAYSRNGMPMHVKAARVARSIAP